MPSVFSRLDDYQQHAAEFALRVKTSALLFEQGTGKTWIAGAVLERLTKDPEFCALIVVPLTNLDSTWRKFLTENLPQVQICNTWDEIRRTTGRRVLLINYERLPRVIKSIRRRVWSAVVYDESQRLKQRSSLASRTAAKLRDVAPVKLILSGTPIDRQPQDLWAQFRFVAPSVLGTKWSDFEREFLEPIDIDLARYRPGSARYNRMLKVLMMKKRKRGFDFSKLPQFLERIGPYSLRVTKKDVLDLPPIRYHPIRVILRGEQRRLYDQLETDMVANINGSVVTAPLRVVQLGKLQQVCGGHVITDDGGQIQVGRAKLRKLKEIVGSSERPVVVFCRYLEEVRAISSEMPGVVECLTGGNRRNRADIINRFQAGEVDVLICQIKTGGVGIDLFRSHVAIFYSYTFSYIDFEQAVARLHRRGQTSEVTIFLLYADDTVDFDVYSAILDKRQVVTQVLEGLKRRREWPTRRPR